MAVNNDIRNKLPDGVIVLDNPAYDNSIVGTTMDGCVIYDYDSMVRELMVENDWDEIDAIEWLEYNTIRAILYMGDKAPRVCREMM